LSKFKSRFNEVAEAVKTFEGQDIECWLVAAAAKRRLVTAVHRLATVATIGDDPVAALEMLAGARQ